MTMKYWNSKRIDSVNARYNIIVGERSNGKTTNILEKILRNFIKTGERGAILRRYEMEIAGHRGASVWNAIVDRGLVTELTDGEWDFIEYRSRAYYFAKYEDNGDKIVHREPFCFIFALSQTMRDKSNSYPNVTTIAFDEFMTRGEYLKDEFFLFQNMISTIVREKADAKVYMLGNTVTIYCPYFEDMGLDSIREIEPGVIRSYSMVDPKTGENVENAIAVERTPTTEGGKESDILFGFKTLNANMIVAGDWDFDYYPKMQFDYSKKTDVRLTAYLIYKGDLFRMRIIKRGINRTLFIEEVSSDTEIGERDILFQLKTSPSTYHFIDPSVNYGDRYTKVISRFIMRDELSYGSTLAGEALKHYLVEANKFSTVKF